MAAESERLEPFDDPVVTPVAQGAVHAVTQWLLTLPENFKIETRPYQVSTGITVGP